LNIRGGEFRVDDQVVVRRGDAASEGMDVNVTLIPDALNILLPR
jgi:hypothetical protein